MLAEKLSGAVGNGSLPTYIEDVFSTYLYTGNGTSQTITTGIDTSTYGGMNWIKSRSNAYAAVIEDTLRGGNNILIPSSTNANANFNGITFGTTGITINPDAAVLNNFNGSGVTYASWTFRKQPKFFDVVTYTGTGANRTVAHSLGSVPGCIIVKSLTGGAWTVYHTSLGATKNLYLNTTDAAATNADRWNNTSPTSTVFSLGTNGAVNGNGDTYVAYIFAHDAGGFSLNGTDNVISCGSFTATPADNALVNLGYEPQYVLVKKTSGVENWLQFDSMRGMTMGDDSLLNPNLSGAENNSAGNNYLNPDPQGFRTIGFSGTYIYIAIRRGPMKVPTDGTKVFKPVTQSAGGTVTTNFPVDMTIVRERAGVNDNYLIDRLRGDSTTSYNYLLTNTTAAASSGSGAGLGLDSNTGFKDLLFGVAAGYIYWNFQRAPSFFDEVCYTGTGSSPNTQTHNLGVAPELIIVKSRSSAAYNWTVFSSFTGSDFKLQYLNTTAAAGTISYSSTYMPSAPTATQVAFGTTTLANDSAVTYVAYLFATCAGVSKVGSYTGNGSTQTINCGFAGGARFVLIKRTDSTGDWYVWDTARGIVSGNDPHLSLNTTSAEVTTDDTIDPDSTGFVVNQLSATNVNVSSATYIYLAIA